MIITKATKRKSKKQFPTQSQNFSAIPGLRTPCTGTAGGMGPWENKPLFTLARPSQDLSLEYLPSPEREPSQRPHLPHRLWKTVKHQLQVGDGWRWVEERTVLSLPSASFSLNQVWAAQRRRSNWSSGCGCYSTLDVPAGELKLKVAESYLRESKPDEASLLQGQKAEKTCSGGWIAAPPHSEVRCTWNLPCTDVRAGPSRRLSTKELMLPKSGAGQASWESLGLQGDQTSPS